MASCMLVIGCSDIGPSSQAIRETLSIAAELENLPPATDAVPVLTGLVG